MKCPTCQQRILDPLPSEMNPNHPMTREMRDVWHKLLAAWMYKQGRRRLMLTAGDFERMTQETGGINVVIKEENDAIVVILVDDAEARRIATREGGLPV